MSSKKTSQKPASRASKKEETSQVQEKVAKKTKSSKSSEPVEHTEKVAKDAVSPAETSDDRFHPQLTELQSELKLMREKFQSLSSTLKKLDAAYRYDIKRVRKHKQKRNGAHKPTGFAKPQVVPDKLAKFIGVKPGDELTGPEITSKVWKQLKERDLTYEKDKRVFRTNKEVTALFNVPASVNDSKDHRDKEGFNFCNLQKYIANALGKAKN